MTITDIFAAIESLAFGARVGVVSGIKLFRSVVWSQKEVKRLQEELKREGGYRDIYKRAIELCNRPIDEDYANPWDIPLAIYLSIIKKENLSEAKVLAMVVASTKNLFWTRKIAYEVLVAKTKEENFGHVTIVANERKSSAVLKYPDKVPDKIETLSPTSTAYALEVV